MMERVLAVTVLFGGWLSPQERNPGSGTAAEGTLYFFFSAESPHSPPAAKAFSALLASHKGKFKPRPVLLVEDWKAWKRPTQDAPLYRAVRELGGENGPPGVNLAVFDEEGLRLAKGWKLTRLPAFVLVAHGKAHLVYGTRVALEELLGCER